MFEEGLIAWTNRCVDLQAFSAGWTELLARFGGILLRHGNKGCPLSILLVNYARLLWRGIVRCQGQNVRFATGQVVMLDALVKAPSKVHDRPALMLARL